ncbi:ABC transporter ATP-binding protein [Paenochrobactrum sp. BZR 588]|uniref:ABC transporter ATP-binding protein n=1 Tax=unclassified Paenochrobactrum TaxID=2639760 RepID=UPI00385197C7
MNFIKSAPESETILEVQSLCHQFGRKEDWIDKIGAKLRKSGPRPVVRAINGVDIHVRKGEIFGIAGESGCGKSTLGRIMAGLIKPTEGQIAYHGKPVMRGDKPANLKLQMIFQDSGAALNPRMQVKDLIGEGPLLHGLVKKRELKDFIVNQLEIVGLNADAMTRYPHQFSGGQRQRINIARALALQPDMIICDESIAALDVSIQAQIINLFLDLKDKLDLTYVFISHDLGVLKHIADRLAVMYLGRVVEQGNAAEIFANPRHPYTQVLLDNVLTLDRRDQQFEPVEGEVPSPLNLPSGCTFHTRCTHAVPACAQTIPPLTGQEEHQFACPVMA